uniref:Uncharacterized protein n=1 Tax=Alloyangia mangrovi TaxID=1779329 RepID=A0A2A3K133_9RHOB
MFSVSQGLMWTLERTVIAGMMLIDDVRVYGDWKPVGRVCITQISDLVLTGCGSSRSDLSPSGVRRVSRMRLRR